VSSLDADRLDTLLASPDAKSFPGRNALESELGRADIVDPEDMPPTVVTMNSTVRFKVDGSNEEFTLTLVYPKTPIAVAIRSQFLHRLAARY